MKFSHEKFLYELSAIVGEANVLTEGSSMESYIRDWTGEFEGSALAVVRPLSAKEIAQTVRLCVGHGIVVVPQGGNTGLVGGGAPRNGELSIVMSMKRMNEIGQINEQTRTISVGAGSILATVQEEVAKKGLYFPLTFGARGSCTIGGVLSTNAGGVNVLRYGTARALCLGIEAVLPDGSIINTMSGLHKDNTGYDVRDLLIGAEGTLGIITAAILKLYPQPIGRMTGFAALSDLQTALSLLNRLRDASGGAVEAFEFVSSDVVDVVCRHNGNVRRPLNTQFKTGILFEVATFGDMGANQDEHCKSEIRPRVEEVLENAYENGQISDAMLAESERQRLDLWKLRESVLESITAEGPACHLDIALPLDRIAEFLDQMETKIGNSGLRHLTIGHLGDGNLHFAICKKPDSDWDLATVTAVKAFAYDLVTSFGGSISAEHGIGQSKRRLLAKRKQTEQLTMMSAIKNALDPNGIMNRGKMVPDEYKG